MKKAAAIAALILVAGALSWLFLLSGLLDSSPRLLRFPLADKAQWDEKTIRTAGFNSMLTAGENRYIEAANLSLRGGLVSVGRGGRRFSFRPRVRGDYQIMLDLYLPRPRPLGVAVYADRKRIIERPRLLSGHTALRVRHRFSRSTEILITFKGSGTLLAGDLLVAASPPPQERDLVFLFCADTLRADHLPIYGYDRDTAPRITAFAKESTVFENAYAQSCWTLPSHMSLFTGLNEYAHGAKRGAVLSPRVPFLVEDVARIMPTRSINGGVYLSSRFGFSRGFDSFFSIPGDQIDPLATIKLARLAGQALDRNATSGFYFLHTYQVHSPYQPAPQYLAALGLHPPRTALSAPTVASNHRRQYAGLDPAAVQNYIDLYDAEIRALDDGFGRFLDYLKQHGLYRRSLIVFFADHGEEFFDHHGWGHGHSLYNELIHVPLVVKFPDGRFAGRRVATPAALVDIMPTVFDYLGISRREHELDGCSLLELMRRESRPKPLLSSLTSGRYIPELPFKISLIEKARKLIYNLPYTRKTLDFFDPDPPVYQRHEVYDMRADPQERHNLQSRFRKWVHSFQDLFRAVVAQARANLQHEGRRVIMDRKMREAFKSLGYL